MARRLRLPEKGGSLLTGYQVLPDMPQFPLWPLSWADAHLEVLCNVPKHGSEDSAQGAIELLPSVPGQSAA